MALRLVTRMLGLLVAASSLALASTVIPEPFFTYSRSFGPLEFRDTKPIPKAADDVLVRIGRLLTDGPLPLDRPMTLYVAEEEWRHWYYFMRAKPAGGVVQWPMTYRHAFLSGADYESDRLTKVGHTVGAPRTLAYYGAHELTHVMTARRVGTRRYRQMPNWIREGLADYVALGAPQNYATLDRELGDDAIPYASMEAHGSYPRARMLVAWALELREVEIDDLLATNMSYRTALRMMRADLAGTAEQTPQP